MFNLSLPTQIISIILFWENVIQVCFCLIGLKHTGNRPSFPPFLALYPRLLSLSVCSLSTYFYIFSFCSPFQQFSFSVSILFQAKTYDTSVYLSFCFSPSHLFETSTTKLFFTIIFSFRLFFLSISNH
jgi:hypothetical protein